MKKAACRGRLSHFRFGKTNNGLVKEPVIFDSMRSENVRDELIQWIKKLDDQAMLGSLLGIKKATEAQDWSDSITSGERDSIERGLKDLEKGRRISSKDFWSANGR